MAAAAGLSSASTAAEIAAHLETLRSETNIAGMARYGIRTDTALGISNPDMRKIARLAGRDHARAMELWKTGIREARMLALYTAEPDRLTAGEARAWAAAFAMIAGAAVHLKREPDAALLAWLPLIERHAGDGRNFVKKAVNWALRDIGKRSMACHAPALALAERLAARDDRTARWIGKDAARELSDEKTLARVRKKA